jgi:hypothetical protein
MRILKEKDRQHRLTELFYHNAKLDSLNDVVNIVDL